MEKQDIRDIAAIAVLPKCIETCENVLLRGGSLSCNTLTEQAAQMAVQYADALINELDNCMLAPSDVEKQNHFLDTKITKVHLSTRTANILKLMDIQTLRDLREKTRYEVLFHRGIGNASRAEILKVMKLYGIEFKK